MTKAALGFDMVVVSPKYSYVESLVPEGWGWEVVERRDLTGDLGDLTHGRD